MKKESANQIKSNIILIIVFMALLFTICLVMYTDIFTKYPKMDLNTNVSLNGGNDTLSNKLQNIIPYIDVTNQKYKTAYQNKKTTISNVHNDVLLTKSYLNLIDKVSYDSGEFLKEISNMYGSNVFIVNESFVVNGTNLCIYKNDTSRYTCSLENYKGIMYKVDRKINNISISDEKILLNESVLFISTETNNNVTYYKVYTDSTYTEIIDSFTNLDVERENVLLSVYLEKYNNKRKQYISTFVTNQNNYNWISTELV